MASGTRLGTVASALRATVDERGRITAGGGWSLDWWIGAEDRWHLPATEATVRQRLVEDAPVVETVMRVPGGDAVQRAYAVHEAGGEGGHDLVVVEIANQTAVPFAVALVLRPMGAVALAERTVLVDGAPAVWLPRPPNRAIATAGGVDELRDLVTSGAATEATFSPTTSRAGHAAAAVLFPLPHTAVLRVAIPLDADAEAAPSSPDAWPSAEQVARGWRLQTERGMRVDLPDETLMHRIAEARGQLLLGAGGDVLAALDGWGYHDDAERALGRYGEPGVPVDGAALVAMARHWRLTRDRDWVEARMPAVLAGVQACGSRLGGRHDPMRQSGLAAAVELLAAVDQPDAARRVARRAARLPAPPPRSMADDLLLRVRDDLVREGPGVEPSVLLASGFVSAWRGQPLDVRDAPTVHGVVSYALRWHGERPALLWEVERGAEGLTLTAPALDPAWTATGPRGDALLSAGAVDLEQGASFS